MIQTYTDEQLQAELDRRKRERQVQERPRQRTVINLTRLRKHCQNHIDALATGDAREDDERCIYEVAMITVFGKSVFDWINERTP